MDGGFHQVPVDGGRPQTKDWSYLGHLDQTPNGLIYYKTGVEEMRVYSGSKISPAELESQKLASKIIGPPFLNLGPGSLNKDPKKPKRPSVQPI
jgi:hypothetical protein